MKTPNNALMFILALAAFFVFPGWPSASIVCCMLVYDAAQSVIKHNLEMQSSQSSQENVIDAERIIQSQADVTKKLDDFEKVLKSISLAKAFQR